MKEKEYGKTKRNKGSSFSVSFCWMFFFAATAILNLKGQQIDISGIAPTFTRALPKNLLEISQIIANLWGKVSRKTLLSQIPFVEDVDEELKALDEEEEKAIEKQQALFGMQENTPPGNKDTKDDVDE